MKAIIQNLTQLQKDCATLTTHPRMNRLCEFYRYELPDLIEILKERQQYIEQLEAKLAQYEGGNQP